MRRDEELELVEDDEDLDEEDLDDEDLEELEAYPVSMGIRGFVAGVLVGALVGAGVALLVAPDRGETVIPRSQRGR